MLNEVIKPQKDESIRLEITLTAEQFAQLEKAKDLLSHVCPEGSWAEVISTLASKFNKKLESNSAEKLTPSVRAAGMTSPAKPLNRSYISIHKKRFLLQKAKDCCEFVDVKSGKRCASKYQLQIDHRHPKARGGSDDVENLRVLCRTHNLLMAERWGLMRSGSKQRKFSNF
jgi:hypothetical protein